MIIRFVCPLGHRLIAHQNLAGQKGQCPVCFNRFVVPVRDPRPSGRVKKSWNAGPGGETREMVTSAASVGASAYGQASAGSGVGLPQPAPAPMPPGSSIGPQPGSVPQAQVPPASVPQPQVPQAQPPGAQAAPTAQAAAPQAQLPQPAVPTAPPAAAPQAVPAASPFDAMPEVSQLESPTVTPGGDETFVPVIEPKTSPVADSLAARAGKGKLQTVYLLAAALAIVVICSIIPVLAKGHLNVVAAPGWARAVLLVGALQLAYIVWLVALPDWSTVWVGMLLFALVAAAYGMFWMIIVFTAPGEQMILSLHDLPRSQAGGWCASVVLVTGLMSYFCGRISANWRRDFELARRGKSRDPLADLT